MPIAFNRNACREYRLKDDTTGTVFFWKSLDHELLRSLRNAAMKATGVMTAPTDAQPKLMEYFEDVSVSRAGRTSTIGPGRRLSSRQRK